MWPRTSAARRALAWGIGAWNLVGACRIVDQRVLSRDGVVRVDKLLLAWSGLLAFTTGEQLGMFSFIFNSNY
jgi:hypothetical protein